MLQTVSSAVLRVLLVSLLLLTGAHAQLPKRDLTVELRQVEEGREDGAMRWGTQPDTPWIAPQKIQVRNGDKGSLRMHQSVPMQWVQSANSQSHSISAGDTSVSSSGGGVTQSVQWLDVGQSITVTPRWPGGNKDATVEVDVQQADMAVRNNADMPRQARHQLSTTVTTPLGQWVTIAATGHAPARPGKFSSEGGAEARRLLQLRVLAP
nr:hypothetical protein [uncultured Rhodoferax sp.]